MSNLTLDVAKKIAEAAFEAGKAMSVTKMTVVVTDPGGHIRLAMRGDGVGNFGVRIAHAKCKTALGFQRSSLQLSAGFTDAGKVAGLTAATDGEFLPIGGGVVITDADGEVLGGAAVAGSAPENDEKMIVAGVIAAGLKVPD